MTEFVLRSGNTTLHCVVEESPVQILSRPLLCGAELKRTITRRVGVSAEEREDLEASVSAGLGLKTIASFESAIKATTSNTYTFEESVEVTDEVTYKAPPNGRYDIELYQMKQIFSFTYTDLIAGIWKRTREQTVTKMLERWIDRSKRYSEDPACTGVQPDAQDAKPPDGQVMVVVAGGKYVLFSDYTREGETVTLNSLDVQVGIPSGDIDAGMIELPADVLPAHARFFADVSTPTASLSMVRLLDPQVTPRHFVVDVKRRPEFWTDVVDIKKPKSLLDVGGAQIERKLLGAKKVFLG